jgi:hypothetical protein
MLGLIANATVAAAQAGAKAGFDWFATKAYEQTKPLCSEFLEGDPTVQKALCLALRAVVGADEKEWKAQLQQNIGDVIGKLDQINNNVTVISNNVNKLLNEMALLHLEINEVAVGSAAYSAIQAIRVAYGGFKTLMQNLPNLSRGDARAANFFNNVLHSEKLQDKIDTIFNALIYSVAGKACLLRNIVAQIGLKGRGINLLRAYDLYEEYVTSIIIDLLKGNMVVESAVLYFEAVTQDSRLARPRPLPFSTREWKDKWEAQLEDLIDNFNTNLEWFVLTRYTEEAKGINPFFLPADARRVFWCADAFCSRYTGKYGLKGRIFDMGGQFAGTVLLNDGTSAVARRFDLQIEEKLDYWSATGTSTPKVYDKIDFSDIWTVHRFHMPAAKVGNNAFETVLPYAPPPIEIETLENIPGRPAFGSFVEVARAGGGFAFFSGNWVEGHDNDDSSNQDASANKDIAKVTEYRALSDYTIRDGDILIAVKRPEVGLAKGGRLHRLSEIRADADQLKGRTETHLTGSFRTWLQTTKTITFPALSNEHVHMVVSLATALHPLTDFPGAGKLNEWLKGPVGRVTQPTTDITDADIRDQQVIAGVNYDSFRIAPRYPSQGCNVEGGMCLVPVAGEPWEFAHAENPNAWQISRAYTGCGPEDRGVFREQATEARIRTRSFLFPNTPAKGLKFRFQAFYDLSIETFGAEPTTPFAVYARGALDNVHFELMSGQMGARGPVALNSLLNQAECRCFGFDYDSGFYPVNSTRKGKLDHVIAYSPGPGGFIGAYGRDRGFRFSQREFIWGKIGSDYVGNAEDRVLAFDYNGTGRSDHLVFHRPSTGRICVVANKGGTFLPVHEELINSPDPADRIFAFDFNSRGRLDHLVIYTPGAGRFSMIQMTTMNEIRVFDKSYGDPANSGIPWDIHGLTRGWRDLKNTNDRMIAFDYNGTGKLDHLLSYRPGSGEIAIFKKHIYGGPFAMVWSNTGIVRYDLRSTADRAFAFDYDGSGKLDHLVLYRPGTGSFCIVKKNSGISAPFSSVYHEIDPGHGIGGCDLKSTADRAFAFDYNGSGKLDHLFLYRPGTGTLWVVKKNPDGSFSKIFPA